MIRFFDINQATISGTHVDTLRETTVPSGFFYESHCSGPQVLKMGPHPPLSSETLDLGNPLKPFAAKTAN